jgi:Flp pilus assembly protein TadB
LQAILAHHAATPDWEKRSQSQIIRNSGLATDLSRRIVARIKSAGRGTTNSVRKRLDTIFHEYANGARSGLTSRHGRFHAAHDLAVPRAH